MATYKNTDKFAYGTYSNAMAFYDHSKTHPLYPRIAGLTTLKRAGHAMLSFSLKVCL